MNKYFLPAGIILCLSVGVGLGFALGRNEHSSSVDTPKIIQEISGKETVKTPLLWQNSLPAIAPTNSSDCDKLSDPEKENCLFSTAIRGAKNIQDTSACKSLRDPARCEKAIADQFSGKFNIFPK